MSAKRIICIPREDAEFTRKHEFRKNFIIKQWRKVYYEHDEELEKDLRSYPTYTSSWGTNVNVKKLAKAGRDVDDPGSIVCHAIGTRAPICGVHVTKLDKFMGIQEAWEKRFINDQVYYELMSRVLASGIMPRFDETMSTATLIRVCDLGESTEYTLFEKFINSTMGHPPNKRTTMSMAELGKINVTDCLKILEAQWLTGGIIDIKDGIKLGLTNAERDGLISKSFMKELKDNVVGPWIEGEDQSYSDLMNQDDYVIWKNLKVTSESFENISLRVPFLISDFIPDADAVAPLVGAPDNVGESPSEDDNEEDPIYFSLGGAPDNVGESPSEDDDEEDPILSLGGAPDNVGESPPKDDNEEDPILSLGGASNYVGESPNEDKEPNNEEPIVIPPTLQTSWGKPVALKTLVENSCISPEDVKEVLDGIKPLESLIDLARPFTHGDPPPVAGYWRQDTGEKIPISKAVETNLISPGLGRAMLEAQAANGAFLDPNDPHRIMKLEEAEKDGFISKDGNDHMIVKRAITLLYENINFKLFEGDEPGKERNIIELIKHPMIRRNRHFQRLMSLQLACGGLIHPELNFRVPLEKMSDFFDQVVVDFVKQINSQRFVGFYLPSRDENMSYKELCKRAIMINGVNVLVYDPENANKNQEILTPEDVEEMLSTDLGQNVTIDDISEANLLPPDVIKKLENGKITKFNYQSNILSPIEMNLKSYPKPIIGVLDSQNQTRLWAEAHEDELISKMMLKEMIRAQVACGIPVDMGSIPPDSKAHIERIEDITQRSIDGSKDLSLLQALEQRQLREHTALQLIDAQLATGGVIDHRAPFRVNYYSIAGRGLLDEPEMWKRKIKKAVKKGLYNDFEEDSYAKTTYSKLISRSVTASDNNLYLPVKNKPQEDLPLSLGDLKNDEDSSTEWADNLDVIGHSIKIEDQSGTSKNLTDAVRDGDISEERAQYILSAQNV